MADSMNVAVVLGGTNEERNVSLATGRAVVAALRERGHIVVAVDPAHGVVPPEEEGRMLDGAVGVDPPGLDELARLGSSSVGAALADLPAIRRADVVFLALHGEGGEDGTIQGLLDLADVAYTGSGCLGSAIAFDKRISKELLVHAGVSTPAWTPAAAASTEIVETLGLPLVVKPSSGGSTVGLTVVRSPAELEPAMELAALYDVDVLCEAFVPGRELTVAVLAGEALPPVEIIPSHEIYDYECKYTAGMSKYEAPADLPPGETARLQDLGSGPTGPSGRVHTAGSTSSEPTMGRSGAWRRTACRASRPRASCLKPRRRRGLNSRNCVSESPGRPSWRRPSGRRTGSRLPKNAGWSRAWVLPRRDKERGGRRC